MSDEWRRFSEVWLRPELPMILSILGGVAILAGIFYFVL